MTKHFKKTILLLIAAVSVTVAASFSFAQEGEFQDGVDVECDLDNLDGLTDAQLQRVLDKCEEEIEEQKVVLAEKQKETASVSRDVSILNYQINQSEAYIKAKALQIRKIQNQIEEQKLKVVELEQKAESAKEFLADLINEKNKLDSFSFLEAILSKKTISEFFADLNDLDILEREIGELFGELEVTKVQVEENRNQLEEEESVERELTRKRQEEIQTIEVNKKAKEYLLSINEAQEEAYEKVIEEKERVRNEIRNRIFRTVGGAEISFGDALNLIRPYEKTLGVDAAFILAILFQESGWGGKIGGNIGQCYYNNIHSITGRTVMSPNQKPYFLQITEGLGINPDTQKVSCPIPRDGAYGGAMGPAQFMPATWMEVRASAANILGIDEESISPFNNQDSFVASGVFLRDLSYSASCNQYVNEYSNIASPVTLRERCAASRYYAGGNWWKFRFTYGDPVTQRADRFRADIKTLGL